MKRCNRCEIEKDLSEFGVVRSKRNNYVPKYVSICKKCSCEKSKIYGVKNREKRKAYNKKYKQKNKEYILEYNRNWAFNNAERYKSTKKRLYEKVKNTEEYKLKKREYYKSYRLDNKEELAKYHREYVSNRKKVDIIFMLREYYKGMISNCFREFCDNGKSLHTNEILGCTYGEFKTYIESKFESWMTWENRALYNGELNYGWDIDHIIPISMASNQEEAIKLNHFTNLQPLCSKINREIKKNKILIS